VLPAWSIAIAPHRQDAGPTVSSEGCRAALPYLTISPAIAMYRTFGSYTACSRQAPPRRLNQSAPESVSISSGGLYLYCE
jgi:hypothetical protein